MQKGAIQVVRTNILVGAQLDEFDYRLMLREYHRDLTRRYPEKKIGTFEPRQILNELMPELEPECNSGVSGGRYRALRRFAKESWKLDMGLTGSDYGPFEQRASPYSFERCTYHLGRELAHCRLKMEFPGYNPYRSTRRVQIGLFRDHIEDALDLLPDYLWWDLHDRKDEIVDALSPGNLEEIKRQLELYGFKVASFGVYFSTMETLHMESEDLDSEE